MCQASGGSGWSWVPGVSGNSGVFYVLDYKEGLGILAGHMSSETIKLVDFIVPGSFLDAFNLLVVPVCVLCI